MTGVRWLLNFHMLNEEEWYYDNVLELVGLDPDLAEVERVYGLDFSLFSETDWDSLARIYQLLPEWRQFADEGCPYWFGSDEENPPYLWASVEPSGLQVHGVLSLKDWEGWDSKFRGLVVSLPRRRIA